MKERVLSRTAVPSQSFHDYGLVSEAADVQTVVSGDVVTADSEAAGVSASAVED